MKMSQFSQRTKNILKFELQLLIGVALGSLALIWVLNSAIYGLAHVGSNLITNFANHYSTNQDFR